MYKIVIGNTYGRKRVISMVGQRGPLKYFRTECLDCGHVCIMYADSIGRRKKCDKCRLRRLDRKINKNGR